MEKQTRNFIMTATNASYAKALKALKKGARIARAGWNGKGMYLVHFSPVAHNAVMLKVYDVDGGTEYPLLPFILMKTADDCYVPWTASQTDQLENDWCVFELGFEELEVNEFKDEEVKEEQPMVEDEHGESEPEYDQVQALNAIKEWNSVFSSDFVDSLTFLLTKKCEELEEEAKAEAKASNKEAMKLVDEIITALDDAIENKENSLKDKIDSKLSDVTDNSRRAKIYSIIFKDDCEDTEAEVEEPKNALKDAITNNGIFVTGMPLRLISDSNLSTKLNEQFVKKFNSRVNESLKHFCDTLEAAKLEKEQRLENNKLYAGKTLLNTFFSDDKTLIGSHKNNPSNFRDIYSLGLRVHDKGFEYLQLADGTCFKLEQVGSNLKLTIVGNK